LSRGIAKAHPFPISVRPEVQGMATLDGNLWQLNLAKVVVVDVSDDYRLMQPPMPSDFYPVLQEMWLPAHRLKDSLHQMALIRGYLYDWHESPAASDACWYVGVVQESLATA
jgi:hypothetical protein